MGHPYLRVMLGNMKDIKSHISGLVFSAKYRYEIGVGWLQSPTLARTRVARVGGCGGCDIPDSVLFWCHL